MDNELELISRAANGDESAFARLVCAHEKVLFNLAYRMLRDPEDARDVTQAAFVKAYRHLDRFDGRHRFFSWLYRIMMNEALNLIARRRAHVSLGDQIASRERLPDEVHERERTREAVEQALAQLSPAHRDVIVLRHFLGFTYQEIGRLLGISDNRVRSRLHEARRRLDPILQRNGVISEAENAASGRTARMSRR